MANLVEIGVNFIKSPNTHVAAGVFTLVYGMGDLDDIKYEIAAKANESYPPVVTSIELARSKAIISSFNSRLPIYAEEIVLAGGATLEIHTLANIESLKESYTVTKKEEVRQSAISSMKTYLSNNRPFERTARPFGILGVGIGLFGFGVWRGLWSDFRPRAKTTRKTSSSNASEPV